ncbi:uncharacterized protein BP5553_10368 [Venustampulla echinocandica]|uniref:Heterokaryon incompatibility domain-containing protein n=1 Tax=Venustampulla echinocandica TaxID=2656787 RepID=A0A370T9Z9_9HELO|nr:uncharacterized protein BP5553_10368 [Venustampulla echinocandica]RDL30490.1 hypothetical protein BP5553_10368 [Venustampulla echinocandica]
MPFCNSCQNITFNPENDDSLDYFEAVIHPDFASLKRSAKSRKCTLCAAVYGMIRHQDLWFPSPERDEEKKTNRLDIALSIQYKVESSDGDEWEFVEKTGKNDGDAPTILTVRNGRPPSCSFRICNREVISRSSWRDEQEETAVSAVVLEGINGAIGGVSSDTSTGSDASMELMRLWIEKCKRDHKTCGKKPSESVPTRLLDVSFAEGESGVLFLVPSAQLNRPPYATLSHRWKKGSYVTTSSTEQEHIQEGIPAKLLPRTFREASITAKKLGLKYLWIDSLCILQDSRQDKVQEMPKMADYYQNAELNICAATGDSEGLWQERDGKATRPFDIPITIRTPGLRRKTRKVLMTVAPILKGVPSHLDSRGWILQERIFSRRTLFFDPYWVYFECAEMSASESCPEGVRRDQNTDFGELEDDIGTTVSRDPVLSDIGGMIRDLSSQVDSGMELGDAERNAAFGLWFNAVENYSKRQLSFETDRLNAISALAERFSRILKDKYIGGIWERNCLVCLQWCHGVEDMDQLTDTRVFEGGVFEGAPTWSWASVRVGDKPGLGDSTTVEVFSETNCVPLVQILGIKCEIESNTFSDISQAKLTLLGHPLCGWAYSRENGPDASMDMVTMAEELEALPHTNLPPGRYGSEGIKKFDQKLSRRWWLHIGGEMLGQRSQRVLDVFPDTGDAIVEGVFYLLPLADYPNDDNTIAKSRQYGRAFGLILKELDNGMFRRVGYTRVFMTDLMTAKTRSMVLV